MTDHAKAQRLAERVGALIFQRDASSHFLDITLDAIGPGTAQLSMTVTESMLNGVGICHGGFTYKLADDAFAYACNSHNRIAVGQHCTVSYPAPARLGDRLVATGREVFRQGRGGVYDVVVATAAGVTVALFRGHCRFLDGHHLEDGAA
ncbi:MAG: phenylacetate pathway hotdog-fold thioesterase [Pseudomonadota bacterium]|jgi:acyl-CoA thioesterase